MRQFTATDAGAVVVRASRPQDELVDRHRPSGSPTAAQRRAIGVVVRGSIGGRGPRRWHAGGLLLSWNTVETALYSWSARYDIVPEVVLCRMIGGAQCQTPHIPLGRRVREVGGYCGCGCGPRKRLPSRIRPRLLSTDTDTDTVSATATATATVAATEAAPDAAEKKTAGIEPAVGCDWVFVRF